MHLSSFGSDAVSLAIDLVRQAREVGKGVMVEGVMMALVGPVFTALGIACLAANSNNNNSELDPATGELEQVTHLT